MRVAIMGSGGDAPGMNPAIKRFVEYSLERGAEPWFVIDGLEGLIDGDIRPASYKDVAGIIHRGGAIIGSSRSERFRQRRYRKQAFDQLRKRGIEGLVVLGGDGSFRAMEIFTGEFDIAAVGIPTTIDNDIYGTDVCLGVDTALEVIKSATDNIRDTASTLRRAFVVETMGRECGYLAAVSAITSGAEVCVIPELAFDLAAATRSLKAQIERGRRYILAIVAEGSRKRDDVARWLEEDLGMETRVTVLGHIQRGGNPSVQDRLLAFGFAVEAVDRVLEKKSGVVGYKRGEFYFYDFRLVSENRYEIDPEILKLLKFLG